MRRRSKKSFRVLAGLTAILLGAAWVQPYDGLVAYAVLDEASAVRFDAFSRQNTIENGTLFIGTYLIHMEAMTDELYAKAQESAEDSGQYEVYYKSELADGTWYDISSAEGLADITKGAKAADEATMAALWVTYYAGRDGIVRDARSSAAVSIFDQPSPYNLYELPELEALKIQYDNTYTADSTGVKRYFHNQLAGFFALDLKNDVTEECDRQLAVLQRVYERLKNQDKAEQAEIVYGLMGKIDAKRRAEVFYQLMEADNSRLEQLQMAVGGSGYNKGDYDDEQFTESSQLSDAVGTAMESCETSYITHSGNQLADDGTVMGSAEYAQSMRILQKAESGNAGLDGELEKLENISNIRESRIKNKDAELALLDAELLPAAEKLFTAAATSGAGPEYRAAVAQGKDKAVCQEFLDARKTLQDKYLSEYQFLIKARAERMGSQEAMDFLYGVIENTGSLYDSIQGDAYETRAQAGVDEALRQLQELAQSVIDGDSSLQSALDKLESDKESTRLKRDEALDANNLALAKKYDAMLEAIDAEIAAEESRLAKELSGGSALDKAKAAAQLGKQTETANIMKLKNKALSGIAEGNTSGIAEAAEGLAALGAEDALKELLGKAGEDTAAGVRNAIASALDSLTEEASAQPDAFGMTPEELLAGLEDSLGSAFEDMSAAEQASALGALSGLQSAGSTSAGELAGTLAGSCLQTGNPYVYVRYSGAPEGSYISAEVIAKVTKFRYIYSASRKSAVLSSRGLTYRFTVGSGELVHPDGTVEEMQYQTALQGNTAYIPGTAAEEYFGCRTEYIAGTEYAVCITAGMEDSVARLMEEFGKGTE